MMKNGNLSIFITQEEMNKVATLEEMEEMEDLVSSKLK